jgi:hypothetical protein
MLIFCFPSSRYGSFCLLSSMAPLGDTASSGSLSPLSDPPLPAPCSPAFITTTSFYYTLRSSSSFILHFAGIVRSLPTTPPHFALRRPLPTSIRYYILRSSPAMILRVTVREVFSSMVLFGDTAAAPSLPTPHPYPSLSGVHHYDFHTLLHSPLISRYDSSFPGS